MLFRSVSEDGGEHVEATFKGDVFFKEGAGMENVRAYMLVQKLMGISTHITYIPDNLLERPEEVVQLLKKGLTFKLTTSHTYDALKKLLEEAVGVEHYQLELVMESPQEKRMDQTAKQLPKVANETHVVPSLISVPVDKLDSLLDFVGEIVIAESMVLQHPELKGLELPSFRKAARQLVKLTDELQDITMSLRMLPMTTLFNKMGRLVRDASKTLDKKVKFQAIGADTQVDKNILDQLNDPLMHLIRNAVDHGVESAKDRIEKGKNIEGMITLKAQNTGGDIIIEVADDGAGLDTEKILKKAKSKGIIDEDADLTESEIYNLVLLPGFSTKEKVTELSGRGVGMDVVRQHLEQLGGHMQINSIKDVGTTIYIRIPLTLAIIEAIKVGVGNSIYTIPISHIKSIFKANADDIVYSASGTAHLTLRKKLYPIICLYKHFEEQPIYEDLAEGMMLLVEGHEKAFCLFVDTLVGEQQVVIKALPQFLERYGVKEKGIGGCVILGDGSVSLVLEVNRLLE